MESKQQPSSIEQQYNWTITLDRNQRESKREEERLRGRRNNRAPTPRLNNNETQQQQLPWPQVWPRRQEIPQQQVQTGSAPIKKVKRTNIVIVCSQQQRVEFAQCNPYTIDVDRRENRNCYNYRRFRYLARNCRNRGMRNRIGEGRRLEYRQKLMIEGNNRQNNLNGEGDLVVLDQVSIIIGL